MKIYRLAEYEQENMPFYNETVSEPVIPQSLQLMPKTTENFEQLLEEEDPSDLVTTTRLLKQYGFDFQIVNFTQNPEDQIIVINLEDGKYVIPDTNNPTHFEDAEEWIANLPDMYLYQYMPPNDFSEDFWQQPISPLYHATSERYLPQIQKEGLVPKNASRGISNRNTGSAIFTSDNEEDTDSYGDVVIVINTVQMKQDGYTPPVSKETPLEEEESRRSLAWKIGIRDYEGIDYGSDGLYDSTVIFYDTIPAKYLTVKNRETYKYSR